MIVESTLALKGAADVDQFVHRTEAATFKANKEGQCIKDTTKTLSSMAQDLQQHKEELQHEREKKRVQEH